MVETELYETLVMNILDYELVLTDTLFLDFTVAVEELTEDGSAQMRATIDRLKQEEADQLTEEVLEEAGFSKELLEWVPAWEAASGLSYTFAFRPENGIETIEGGRALVDTLRVDATDPPAGFVMAQKATLESRVGDESARVWLEGMMNVNPGHDVKIGDSWTEVYALPLDIPTFFQTTYTVREMNEDAITLDAAYKVGKDGTGVSRHLSEFDGRVGLTGGGSGKVEIDAQTGWVRKRDLSVRANGVLNIGVGGERFRPPVQLRIRQTVTSR